MKKTISFTLIFIAAVSACLSRGQPSPAPILPAVTTEISDNHETQPDSTPTLNAVEQALATQAANPEIIALTTPRTSITMPENSLQITSPNGDIKVHFGLIEGTPYYAIRKGETNVMLPSRLGFRFLTSGTLENDLSIVRSVQSQHDETWRQPWGEVETIRDHHNELRVFLSASDSDAIEFTIVFRVFDDGVGFRYELPEQPALSDFAIMDELTEFALSGDHSAWWIPAFQDNRYEYLYRQSNISQLARSGQTTAHTPFTMETVDGLYLSIHEAALINYSSMTLQPMANLVLKTRLVPWSDGVLVRGKTPFNTPWRTIQIAETAGDLITSYLVLNLNEPNKLNDTSWIKPGKYIGIWWAMHVDKWTWESGPRHGATTDHTKEYLDFAAANGFAGVLVEGWNKGWDGNWFDNGKTFNFTAPYLDFDLEDLAAYATTIGTKIIGHHETGAAVANYEEQMEAAFSLYQRLGIDTVKTGYVGYGQGIERYDSSGDFVGMEWHHGQYMVEHYQRVVETAARYGIMINAHEPIKDTGLRRTYPNFMTREGARGQEYNAWDGRGGNPPDHVTILPFTRLLAGPMDYTPGVLDLTFDEYRANNQVNHTLAKELALYVVIYSPLQMAADLIENYVNNPAFQFIRDVPADWEETQILEAEIGSHITTVRKARESQEWFLGAITNESPRKTVLPLDFLQQGITYTAEIYSDGAGAHWEKDPYPLNINRFLVNNETRLEGMLAPGGGLAVRFYPATETDIATLQRYQP